MSRRTRRHNIHDLFTRTLEAPLSLGTARHTTLLSDTEHLLRRFGQADLIELEADGIRPARTRAVADEIWVLVEGEAAFALTDRRPGSPSEGTQETVLLEVPGLILIPFGVEFNLHAHRGCRLIRFTTHIDGAHPADEDAIAGKGG